MSMTLAEWGKATGTFTLEAVAGAITLHARPGREAEFDAFARRIINTDGEFAVFPRRASCGHYDSVQILGPMPPFRLQPDA